MKKTKALPISIILLLIFSISASLTQADHTATPTNVTAAGSFQSEAGCSADWQPDCAVTHLTYNAADDLWQGTFNLPAGDYEAKVAINDSWDENYGADGVANGGNILFSITGYGSASFSYDHTTHQTSIFVEDGNASAPGDEALVRPVLQHPVQDEILYFAIPDRFNNGSDANDCGDYSGTCVVDDTQENVLTHGFLPSDKGYYHGGDLKGLSEQLDYLEGLGVTSIWVGPIFKNKPVQPDISNLYGHSSGYHGYWILDYEQVDPHLGTNQEFKDLVADAHARGINIFMDIITNHTADVIQLEGNAGYRGKADFPYLDINGDSFNDSDFAYSGQPDYNFPEVNLNSFPYTPVIPAGEEDDKNPAWLNDPTLYHNRGDSSFTGENSLYGDFFGLDDLWTERKEVVDGMIDIYSYWIEEFGVDGFRIDTTKHVNMEFWQKFGPDILAAAEAEGIDHFFAFGEVFDQQFGAPFLSEFSTRGQLQSTIDFAFQLAARDFASQSGATDNLRDFFAEDDYYTDADSNAYSQPTFLGNHDMGRIGHFLQRQDQVGATDAELLARSKLAHGLMFFARGQPVIYYGDEQGFTGDGGDKDAREDMFPNVVAVYEDNDLIGTDKTTSDDNFDTDHPLYQAFSAYADLYTDHAALRRGAQIHRTSEAAAGIYAFSRIERDEKIEYIIALNNAETEGVATVPTFYGAGVQFDLLLADGGTVADNLTTDASGNLNVTVPPLGFVVYQAQTAIPASSAAPGISIAGLTNDQTVDLDVQDWDGHRVIDRIEVGATLTEDIYAEVTFAVKINGGEWTPIGTDDNPPYRVFYPVYDLPEGATLDFKAIASDLHGNISSASVSNITPNVVEPQPPVPGDATYAIIHYNRPAGDYGDHTTGDFNDFWGLHLWGEAIDPAEVTEWPSPKPFLGEDEFGRFAWIRLADTTQPLNFIIHKGDVKDGTDADRSFIPSTNAEIWINGGEAEIYTSQAAAQGFVTIHYQRPDGDYGDPTSDDFNDFWGLHLWGDALADGVATDWPAPRKPDGIDDFGAYWEVPIQDASQSVNFIIHRGDNKDPGPDQNIIPAEGAHAYIVSGDQTIYKQQGEAENFVLIHYHRPAGDYGDPTSSDFNDFWGLHVWDGAANPTDWADPIRWENENLYGPIFRVDLVEDATNLAYIIHKGDEKDPGPDQRLEFSKWGYEVWQLQGEGPDPEEPHYIRPVPLGAPGGEGDLSLQKAHWVSEDTIAWRIDGGAANEYALHYAAEGGLSIENGNVSGDSIALTYDAAGLSADILAKFPHLAGYAALKIGAADLAQVPTILKGQIAVAATNGGTLIDATGLQIPGVLDDLYTYNGELGVVFNGDIPTLYLWAPTAKSVTFHLFDNADPATTSTTQPMTLDPATGVWSITGDVSWKNKFYLFEVEVFVNSTGQVENNLVTDPYSFSLAANSSRSQIVDLNDSALTPSGWDGLDKPDLANPEDIALYELHVRDFSWTDETVSEDVRGTFKAFTIDDSDGMEHLDALADAGLTHIHLLPSFDIATIEEIRSQQQEPAGDLSSFAPDSEAQQAAVEAVKDADGFNWGYDPWHYTVPEGSYSTNPDGSTRIIEFREMVKSLNETGLHVVMDVVYNHTNSAGQDEKSVLDRVVPGYYHRLDENGAVTTSTCCQNTATEHNMMEKLMIDSVLVWAKQYKVDGFRFDLMGHHSKANMLKLRAALDALTVGSDGVDGSQIYVYGEGWNFGEVENNARFEQATQANMAGTGIGTFNDRLRDAVRGGGPFDGGQELITNQGVINGLYYDPNANNSGNDSELADLLLSADQIRVGLAGNLADFEFVDRNGNTVTGSQVDYNNGSPTGYNDDPQEHIVYVSAHDNQTLFDNNQYKHPTDTDMDDRVRAQKLGIDFTVLAQGVPFFHAGVDMLRSKSLDRDSFNSGDWFNQLDFTYEDNNWGVGLPVAEVNSDNWPIMQPLLADPDLDPDQSDIEMTVTHMREMLEIRQSSKLFRLTNADDIQELLAFHNTGPDQIPGLIVMSLSDNESNLDPDTNMIVVLFNASDEEQSITVDMLVDKTFDLHPIQQDSSDDVVKNSTFVAGTFTIPARTTAVFVEGEDGEASLINDAFELSNMTTRYRPNPVENGPAGVFTIQTTFTNVMTETYRNIFFKVEVLTGNNLLLNADGGPGGVGSTLTIPNADLGSDGKLTPGESFQVSFEIGLAERKQFDFFVDLYGVNATGGVNPSTGSPAPTYDDDSPVTPTIEELEFEITDELLVESQNIYFLPIVTNQN